MLPGAAPSTSFGSTVQSQIAARGGFTDAYADFAQQTMAAMQQYGPGRVVTTARDVAAAALRAATDRDCAIVLPAGADAIAWSEGSSSPYPGAFEPRPDR